MTPIEIYAENVREKFLKLTDRLFHNGRHAVNHYCKLVL